MQRKYNYDVRYMQALLDSGLITFLKFLGFQSMSAHRGNLPPHLTFAARLSTILQEDCGPCTQLVVDMAIEQQVSPDVIRQVIERDIAKLPEDVSIVLRFTEYVLARAPEANELRNEIVNRWGQEGLVTLSLAISSMRVYPSIKYALGFCQTCQQIVLDDTPVSVTRVWHLNPQKNS